jgi:hypothetical protein
MDHPDDLGAFWDSLPKLLEEDEEDWALREVLESGVVGYTREADTPEGPLIRHNPDGI